MSLVDRPATWFGIAASTEQNAAAGGRSPLSAFEKHYSVQEVAELWGYSENTIRRIFQDEKGVLKQGRPETRFKRKRFQLSIPESVLIRVHQRMSN